ncbi:uncharacterized protein A1O9_09577 [Exophiala aquamarina CBS 119918]|uniref:Uncharacterized protein n=1 Tax=Exophiala aquamarina CBS 119918 TaxID=1182545 RepID=A0A072P3J1_9EURO|nr:uncharacterized protein A1O9_09577 [Exophiala aquamarina CBS 119918]KEF54411.1 hypothetical protein A1O9_09577 [Exophiala aquamarina CBS 119918]
MSYQANHSQPNMGESILPASRPFSKWWPIGFAIASVVLYAVGGGLYGSSCATDGYYYYCSYGLWSGGIAMLSLGGITSTIAIILLIIYLVRRRTPTQCSSASRLNYQDQFAPPPPVNIQTPGPAYGRSRPTKPEADIRELSHHQPATGGKYCGRCGSSVQTPFCPKCGAQV